MLHLFAVNTWLNDGLMQLRPSHVVPLRSNTWRLLSALVGVLNLHESPVQMGSVCWLAALVWLCGIVPPKSVCTSTLATQ